MSEHPNVTRMREAYAAFARGELSTVREHWTDDIVWHEGGHTDLAGTYKGPEAVFALLARLFDLSGGSLRVEPRAFLADDTYGATPVTVTGRRGDRHLEVLNVHMIRFEDGRAAEFWDTSTDEQAMDRFFG